jgi:hypothetical protein
MNSLPAILIVLALNLLVLAPLGLAALRKRTPAWLVGAYSASLLGIGAYQLGFSQRIPIPAVDATRLSRTSLSPSQCTELLTLLDQGGVFVDRRNPPRLVVAQLQWAQLPEEARGAVVDCVQQSWPRGAGTPQVEAR